jgi:enoyl-CoA hydratase
LGAIEPEAFYSIALSSACKKSGLFIKIALTYLFSSLYTPPLKKEGDTMMNYELLDIKIENNIATVALNRVDKMNALNTLMARNLGEAIAELSKNMEVRVIILKSNAKAFCAGIDLTESSGRERTVRRAFNNEGSFYALGCCNQLEECKKPVIAAVNGACIGAGLDIACACDIRLCSEDARFAMREAAMGLVADMGALQRAPLIIGEGFAREMALTGKIYTAREVERMGLVNYVYQDQPSLLAAAQELAETIAANAPIAVEETKETMNYSRNKSVQEGMRYAAVKNELLFPSEDMKEAAAAFRERRRPVFKGK